MCMYDWETKMALQETTRTTLQCKKKNMVWQTDDVHTDE